MPKMPVLMALKSWHFTRAPTLQTPRSSLSQVLGRDNAACGGHPWGRRTVFYRAGAPFCFYFSPELHYKPLSCA